MLDLNIIITVDDLIALGISLLIPPNVYKIRGNFVISASVFETLNYPYLLVLTGSELTEEVSGECELS
jgi:hypothetical protein